MDKNFSTSGSAQGFIMPGIAFEVNSNMIYGFSDDSTIKKTNIKNLNNDLYKKFTLIDSAGKVYKIRRAFFVKYRGFFGYNPLVSLNPFNKGCRRIWVDLEYEPEVDYISLDEVRVEIKKRVSQENEFWEEVFGSEDELYALMDKSTTYEELFRLFI